jgi:hypothetical protein
LPIEQLKVGTVDFIILKRFIQGIVRQLESMRAGLVFFKNCRIFPIRDRHI